MSTILLTGVTGLVGSSVAPLLQERGHRILYLIRPDDSKGAEIRLRETLKIVRDTDIVISGDVTLPDAGFSQFQIRQWKGRVDKIIHGAASIKFDEVLAAETRLINVDGTRTMLKLAEKLAVPEFHFLSTAYVAGSARTFAETDFDVGQTTRNVYESSKWEAERLVRSWPNSQFSIYRLSIIIGDSQTGYVQSFNGYYGFLVGFWYLYRTLQQRWETKKSDYSQEGISFNANGILQLPLCVDCSPTSTINLVTTDWMAQMLVELFSLPTTNQTYHLVHPSSPRVRWAIKTSLKHLGIEGIIYQGNVDLSGYPLLGHLQRMLDRNINRYLPYVTHEPIFGCDNLKRTLGERYVPPPVVDEALLIKILDYAKSVNFGQKMRQPVPSGD